MTVHSDMRKKRKKGVINIGTVLFSAVLIYLIIAFVLFLTKSHVSPYEITEGSIVEDSVYTGVIVRSETEVKANRKGYVNYYVEDNSKAGYGQPVCALSGEELSVPDMSSENAATKKLSSSQESVMLSGIQHYVASFSPDHYDALYDLHNEIDTAYGFNSTDYLADQIDELADEGGDVDYVEAPSDGLIVFTVDSLDGLKSEDVSDKTFNQDQFKERVIRQGSKVKKDENIFRLITDEKWSVLFPLTRKNADKMKKVSMIETRIGNMQSTIWADFEVLKQSGGYFGKLTYHSDMLQFAASRFVSVELILQNVSGLKIPRSALVKRDVIEIPADFIMTDPNTGDIYVLIEDEQGDTVSRKIDVFCVLDQETQSGQNQTGKRMCYLKQGQVEKDSILHKETSNEIYVVSQTTKMDGVYNINKGYASFQYANVIASNKLYYIIEANTPYGPSTYDHIALNADELEENRVVH